MTWLYRWVSTKDSPHDYIEILLYLAALIFFLPRCAGTSVGATALQPSLRNVGKRSLSCPTLSGTSVASYFMERYNIDLMLIGLIIGNRKEFLHIICVFCYCKDETWKKMV